MEDLDIWAEVMSWSEFAEHMQKQEQIIREHEKMLGQLFEMLHQNTGGLPSGVTIITAAAGAIEDGRGSASGDAVVAVGHLPALGEVEDTSDSDRNGNLDVGLRDFGSLKHAAPNFDGGSSNFPLWKRHFEGFPAMSGCVPSFCSLIDIRHEILQSPPSFSWRKGLPLLALKRLESLWLALSNAYLTRSC